MYTSLGSVPHAVSAVDGKLPVHQTLGPTQPPSPVDTAPSPRTAHTESDPACCSTVFKMNSELISSAKKSDPQLHNDHPGNNRVRCLFVSRDDAVAHLGSDDEGRENSHEAQREETARIHHIRASVLWMGVFTQKGHWKGRVLTNHVDQFRLRISISGYTVTSQAHVIARHGIKFGSAFNTDCYSHYT